MKKSRFSKTISLIAIFEERQIKRNKHAVIHLGTGTNETPGTFLFAFISLQNTRTGNKQLRSV